MTVWKYFIWALALTTGSVFGSSNYFAQAATTETNVYLGQVFNVDVLVRAPEKPDAPDLSMLVDFNITALDSGRETSEADTWLYRYAFRPKTEGDLLIPVFNFGGIKSAPIEIRANKPVPTDRMKLTQSVSKISPYVGEPILLTTTWDSAYQFGAIKAVDFHFPVLNDKRLQILELYEPDKESNAQTTGLPVHGTRVLATRKSYAVEGTEYQSLSFNKLLIPKKSGALKIAAATLLCAADAEKDPKQNRRSAFQYPAYFDNTFFDQNATGGNWTRIYTESAPIVLEVKPLPTEGRPDLFNGMVGNYSIHVTAEPKNVRVGEPVTLTVKISAAQFMENIFFEHLRFQPLLINRFEIPTDRSLPIRDGNSKIYTQTVRPLSTAVDSIPPIQLSFFSPSSNQYITVRSASIPITVSEADEVGIFGGGLMQNRLREVEEGIRHNYEHKDMLKNRATPLFGWAHPLAVLLFLLAPPLLVGGYFVITLFGEKKHHIHRTAKAARAYKVFRKNAAQLIHGHTMKSELYSELDRVLRAYLGDRLHLNPGALSYREAEIMLLQSGADLQTLEDLKSLFTRCEAYRFTSGFDEATDAKKIIHDTIHIVKSVERTLK